MDKQLLILTAPPASGKTYWVESFTSQLADTWLFISPLRALAEECKSKWGEQCLVMTPEEWVSKKTASKIIIIDEFHLFFYWGDHFRPIMWEAFYEMVAGADLVVLLTATLSSEMRDILTSYSSDFDQIIWIDQGNQKLKYKPQRYIKISGLVFMQELILFQSQGQEQTNLIFCRYRQEVRDWENKLQKLGYEVLSCVGGEAREFSERLKMNPTPDYIVATSVLSHGVNLPHIRRIFFTYKTEDINFWIQMLARGGRHGEVFEVYALEKPLGLKWNIFFNNLAMLRLKIKIKVLKFFQQIESWFLKV